MRSLFILLAIAVCRSFAEERNPEAIFLTNTRQLIYEGRRSGEGYFHPDGQRLIFQSEREPENPFYQIYTLDLATGDSTRVSPGTGKTTCAFFQSGANRVLFASTHLDPQAAQKQKDELDFRASGKQRRYSWDYDPAMDIFSANADGSGIVQLTKEPGYDAEASFSPDGKAIVFCSLRAAFAPDASLSAEEKSRLEKDPAYFGDIYTMNADGSNVRRLTEAPGYDGGPFFSPDGQRIVWRHFDASGMIADVWTMKTDGSDKLRVTDFQSMSWAPFYHPGGKYFIFTTNKLGFENFELFIVDVDGAKEPVRVTFTDGFDGLPVFSPDGKKLCWTSGRTADKKSQLFLAEWNHEAAVKALDAAAARKGGGTSNIEVPEVGTPSLAAEISAADLKAEVGWLADDAREGRMTGTPGAQAAADWLAGNFRRIGLKPLGESFAEPFEFDAGVKLIAGKNSRQTEQSQRVQCVFCCLRVRFRFVA